MAKQSPVFVRGTWFGNDQVGNGVVVYQTEEQAQQGLQEIGMELSGVRVTRSEIFRVHGEALYSAIPLTFDGASRSLGDRAIAQWARSNYTETDSAGYRRWLT